MRLDLSPIEERLAASTPGTWEWEISDYGASQPGMPYFKRSGTHVSLSACVDPEQSVCVFCSAPYGSTDGSAHVPSEANRAFIAAARDDIRALLEEVKRLRHGCEGEST